MTEATPDPPAASEPAESNEKNEKKERRRRNRNRRKANRAAAKAETSDDNANTSNDDDAPVNEAGQKQKRRQRNNRKRRNKKNNNNKSSEDEDVAKEEPTETKEAEEVDPKDPASTLVRPDLRIQLGSASVDVYPKPLKHDDVVIVPDFFGNEQDLSTFEKLTELMKERKEAEVKTNPKEWPAFQEVVAKVCKYFQMDAETALTRLNWLKDSTEWEPLRQDAAAWNRNQAKKQNITVGVSFGACRELSLVQVGQDPACRVYIPQPNNSCVSLGRDVNVRFQHGVNALKEEDQDGMGRITVLVRGLATNVVSEEGSPARRTPPGRAKKMAQTKTPASDAENDAAKKRKAEKRRRQKERRRLKRENQKNSKGDTEGEEEIAVPKADSNAEPEIAVPAAASNEEPEIVVPPSGSGDPDSHSLDENIFEA